MRHTILPVDPSEVRCAVGDSLDLYQALVVGGARPGGAFGLDAGLRMRTQEEGP
jgi:hypothetical protein